MEFNYPKRILVDGIEPGTLATEYLGPWQCYAWDRKVLCPPDWVAIQAVFRRQFSFVKLSSLYASLSPLF